MKCFVFILIALALPPAAKNEPSTDYRNALGWDDGIAYRKNLRGGFYLGVSAMGSTTRSTRQNSLVPFETSDDDDTTPYKNSRSSTARHTIRLRFLTGKRIIRHEWMNVRFFINPEYSYQWTDSWGYSSENRGYWDFYAGGTAGFEPSFTVLNRFTFGSRFGIRGIYRWAKNEDVSSSGLNEQNIESWQINCIGTDLFANVKIFGYYEF
jgi:hypothetical protein